MHPSTRNQPIRQWLLAGSALLLALACLPVVNWAVPKLMRGEFSHRAGTKPGSEQGDLAQTPVKNRSSERPPAGPRATHGAQQLRMFYLPAMELDGLSLEEAMDRLRAAYEATCRASGETPLALTFSIPPGNPARLRVNLGNRPLESSINMLAALAKLTVQRHGREFRFTAAKEGPPKQLTDTLEIPPDLKRRLFPADDDPNLSAEMLRQLLTASGLALDPSTQFSLRPGHLTIDTTSAADHAAISALVENAKLDPRLHHKGTVKLIEIPAGAPWNHPDTVQFDDAQTKAFMREMATTKGVELTTMPSVSLRAGEPGTIEIVRDLIVPSDDAAGGFETRKVGLVANLQLSPLGLGHQRDVNFTDTTGDIDPTTGAAAITERTAIHDQAFASDASTRMLVQTHPDGTRTVLLVTSTLIDATGRPANENMGSVPTF